MNILDIIIIVLIIIGALLGFVNGGIETFVSAIGFIVVATISFMLKDIDFKPKIKPTCLLLQIGFLINPNYQ